MKRTLVILIALLVVLGLGTSLVAAQQSNNPDIADDGEILSCTTITEPGDYYLGSDLEGNADGSCISITHSEGTVTIDGNRHTLQGPGTDGTIGVQIDSNSHSDGVEIYDITISGWDDGIKQSSGHFSFHDATVTDNQRGYNGGAMSFEFENVEFTRNEVVGISTTMTLPMTMENVEVNNNGAGFSMIDGGRLTVRNSEFNNNDGSGLSIGHSMNATFTNVDVSGNSGPGVGFSGSTGGTEGSFEDSTITNNGEDGIAVRFGPDNDQIELTDVHIDGNARRAIAATHEDGEALARVTATDVTLGGGLTVGFEQEAPVIETTAADWSATDTIDVAGADNVAVETTFDVGEDTGQLWKETNGEWTRQGEYGTTNGQFTETLSRGHWKGDARTMETPTATPTSTPSPTPDPTPTPPPETSTETPAETDTGPGPSGPATATATPDESTPERGVGSGGGGNGAESRPDTPTETDTRDDDSTPSNGETSTPTDTEAATTTENEQVTESPAGTQVTTENQSDAGTPNDGSSSEDLPGFTGVLALIALVGATLLAYRNAETQ